MKEISLAGKWAPTPGASHDRVTNIATAISQLMHASQVITPTPSALNNTSISSHERSAIFRSFYQRWVLTELRQISACPESLMAFRRWTEIDYSRVPSICMNKNSGHFSARDPAGFDKYLVKVESGKGSISGAAMLPHELVAQIMALSDNYYGGYLGGKRGKSLNILRVLAVVEAKKALAETKKRVIEAQWKILIESLREAGTLDNCLAICDVSASMGSVYGGYDKNDVSPIFASISLSLVLASLAKPPFDAGLSPSPLNLSIPGSISSNLSKNKIKPEDMIKRLFVFSDMQFDVSHNSYHSRRGLTSWETTYDFIEDAYTKAGYEVPQIVFWDLSGRTVGPKTVEVESDRKGAAMMNGFSPALLKVFMGEAEEEEEAEVEEVVEEEEEWEELMDRTSSITVAEKEDEFNPINMMKKALLLKSFDGLVVID